MFILYFNIFKSVRLVQTYTLVALELWNWLWLDLRVSVQFSCGVTDFFTIVLKEPLIFFSCPNTGHSDRLR